MENLSVVAGTFTFALLHTLIPSHWLCFVLVGKAQGWSTRKTLAVTATAGLLHVASTIALGVALAAAGHAFLSGEKEGALARIGALVLILLGALYLGSHLFRTGHHHEHDKALTGRLAIAALLFSLVVSPCSLVIPFLILSMQDQSVGGVALVAGILLVTTVGVMLLLVGLTSLGIEKLQFVFFDKYEKLIVGLVLCILGAMILLVHRH